MHLSCSLFYPRAIIFIRVQTKLKWRQAKHHSRRGFRISLTLSQIPDAATNSKPEPLSQQILCQKASLSLMYFRLIEKAFTMQAMPAIPSTTAKIIEWVDAPELKRSRMQTLKKMTPTTCQSIITFFSLLINTPRYSQTIFISISALSNCVARLPKHNAPPSFASRRNSSDREPTQNFTSTSCLSASATLNNSFGV